MKQLKVKPSNFGAGIDYFSVSMVVNEYGFIGNLQLFRYFQRLEKLLVRCGLEGLVLEERNSGLFSYQKSFNLMRPDFSEIPNNLTSVGILAYTPFFNDENAAVNFNSGIFLSLTGLGCHDVDVSKLVNFFIKDDVDFRITRLDIAVDYYYGEVTIEQIKDYYRQGHFKTMGSIPSSREYERKIMDDKAGGYTFYVGQLSSAKSFRAYEKGRQLLEQGSEHPFINWVRLEVQFRNKQCEIPVEMVFDLDSALRGAYPLFDVIVYPQTADFFSHANNILKLKYKKKLGWLGVDRAVYWAGHSYKRLVMYLLKIGYSFQQICQSLILQKSVETMDYLNVDVAFKFEKELNDFQIPKGLRC